MVEWTASFWYEELGAALSSAPPTNTNLRVYRGGGWYGVEWLCRAAYRYWYAADRRLDVLGFRLARSL